MIFWSLNWLSNFLDNMPLMWLIPFIVPDLAHTMVMGQYVWLWIKKSRKDNRCFLQEQPDQSVAKTVVYLFVDTFMTLLGVIRR